MHAGYFALACWSCSCFSNSIVVVAHTIHKYIRLDTRSRVFGGRIFSSTLEKPPVPSHAKVGVILWWLRYYNDCCKNNVMWNEILQDNVGSETCWREQSIDTIGGMYAAVLLYYHNVLELHESYLVCPQKTLATVQFIYHLILSPSSIFNPRRVAGHWL